MTDSRDREEAPAEPDDYSEALKKLDVLYYQALIDGIGIGEEGGVLRGRQVVAIDMAKRTTEVSYVRVQVEGHG